MVVSLIASGQQLVKSLVINDPCTNVRFLLTSLSRSLRRSRQGSASRAEIHLTSYGDHRLDLCPASGSLLRCLARPRCRSVLACVRVNRETGRPILGHCPPRRRPARTGRLRAMRSNGQTGYGDEMASCRSTPEYGEERRGLAAERSAAGGRPVGPKTESATDSRALGQGQRIAGQAHGQAIGAISRCRRSERDSQCTAGWKKRMVSTSRWATLTRWSSRRAWASSCARIASSESLESEASHRPGSRIDGPNRPHRKGSSSRGWTRTGGAVRSLRVARHPRARLAIGSRRPARLRDAGDQRLAPRAAEMPREIGTPNSHAVRMTTAARDRTLETPSQAADELRWAKLERARRSLATARYASRRLARSRRLDSNRSGRDDTQSDELVIDRPLPIARSTSRRDRGP